MARRIIGLNDPVGATSAIHTMAPAAVPINDKLARIPQGHTVDVGENAPYICAASFVVGVSNPDPIRPMRISGLNPLSEVD